MAISTYYDLISAIVDWSPEVSDTDPIATFISLAEGDFFPFVKHYMQETTVSLPIVDGKVTLPDDVQDVRKLHIPGYTLKRVSVYTSEIYTGEIGYTTSGNSYVFSGLPADPVNVEITYDARPEPLSETNPTNWLLQRYSNVYLHGALVRAYRWRQNAQAEAGEEASLQKALGLLATDHKRFVNSGNAIVDNGGGF